MFGGFLFMPTFLNWMGKLFEAGMALPSSNQRESSWLGL